MTELKEEKTGNIYPTITGTENQPTAPVAIFEMNDGGQSFRLSKISEVEKYLENEVRVSENLSKKYLKISKISDNIEGGLTVAALASGAGGIALLSTVVAIPATIALEGCALGVGLGAIVGKFISRRTRTKSEKHLQIRSIAESKLNTLATHISKAISDNRIDHDEFKLIIDELEKYKVMKEEIRSKAKKKTKMEDENSLIEKGKREAREEFRRLMEKNAGGGGRG